jgi:hypothetical protein
MSKTKKESLVRADTTLKVQSGLINGFDAIKRQFDERSAPEGTQDIYGVRSEVNKMLQFESKRWDEIWNFPLDGFESNVRELATQLYLLRNGRKCPKPAKKDNDFCGQVAIIAEAENCYGEAELILASFLSNESWARR